MLESNGRYPRSGDSDRGGHLPFGLDGSGRLRAHRALYQGRAYCAHTSWAGIRQVVLCYQFRGESQSWLEPMAVVLKILRKLGLAQLSGPALPFNSLSFSDWQAAIK